jgi:hypothetical protein
MGTPHPAPDGAPDYIGLVAGVRAWRLANTMWAKMGGYLWSWSMLDCWRKGEEWKHSECKQPHRIPDMNCHCGIWAFFNPELLESGLISFGGYDEPVDVVAGVIGAGGDIVEHEVGFRAQYAKVLAVFDDQETTILVEEIAAKNSFEVISLSDFDAFCTKKTLIRLDKQ